MPSPSKALPTETLPLVSGPTNPPDGWAGLRAYGRKDFTSGFLVSLLALPLCLGIAQASGFPPLAGLTTAIVGGIIGGLLSGAPLTIKGPAAGLIAIALGSLQAFDVPGHALAGYQTTLGAIVAAAVLQIILGKLRVGQLAAFFPGAAVHGMLAAIGLIIVAKQVHTLMGVRPQAKSPLALLAAIPEGMLHLQPQVALIGGASVLILLGWPALKSRWLAQIPSPVVVLAAAIPMGRYFGLADAVPSVASGGMAYLVELPNRLLDGLVHPTFGGLLSWQGLKYTLMFAIVGSVESLLTVQAIDLQDPFHRRADVDKDLRAIGAGNLIAGLLGGLPMIAEVLRSSANVANGAITRWANVAHGLFLLAFLVLFKDAIHSIPLAALAAMLVLAGARLARPKHWADAWRTGKTPFAVFVVTVGLTLGIDLLVGMAAGVVVNLLMNLWQGAKLAETFKAKVSVSDEDGTLILRLYGAAVFSNWLSVKQKLEALERDRPMVIDLREATLVDASFTENLERYRLMLQNEGGSVRILK